MNSPGTSVSRATSRRGTWIFLTAVLSQDPNGHSQVEDVAVLRRSSVDGVESNR
jgi:hypothetical protein